MINQLTFIDKEQTSDVLMLEFYHNFIRYFDINAIHLIIDLQGHIFWLSCYKRISVLG